jgi:hypothetical protein
MARIRSNSPTTRVFESSPLARRRDSTASWDHPAASAMRPGDSEYLRRTDPSQLGNPERGMVMSLIQMWNGFSGVTLRQKRLTEELMHGNKI